MCDRTQLILLALTAMLFVLLGGCSTTSNEVATLRSLDVSQGRGDQDEVFVEAKSAEEVKDAYYEYLQNSTSGEKDRRLAVSRLAEMEIDRLNEALKNDEAVSLEDSRYRESLERTLSLLQTSLNEFPDAPNNDETLYQMAHLYDQLGQPEDSLAALRELTSQYPESSHYAEAQFRLGEAAFAAGDYITAEDAYSEALFAESNQAFYQRSLFKRGWARYKQGLYIKAADDYVGALKQQPFDDYNQLEGSKKEVVDEYFRALALAFANLQDLDILQNFFVDSGDSKYLYHIHRVISDIYLEQERFSDAAGVLTKFVESNPTSKHVPLAKLKVVETWRSGGYRSLFTDSLESFYNQYHPDHAYWDESKHGQSVVADSLRDYVLQLASFHHQRYTNSQSDEEFTRANTWYSRYLEHFSAYAQQDNVYKNYGELLSDQGANERALQYFELAAYDGDIILDKQAAYATITLSNELYQQQNDLKWLDKQLHYALIAARLYTTDPVYHSAALNAAELAFNNKRYEEAVELANALPDGAAGDKLYQASIVKGLAYREAGNPREAETVFTDLLTRELTPEQQQQQYENLAVSIYQQAEQALQTQDSEAAIEHYARVANVTPEADIAPDALYEAIVLSMNNEYWNAAIRYTEHFQEHYPDHRLRQDATRQASSAYLKAGDEEKAARTFEQIAAQDDDRAVKRAALWQAAQLYESREDLEAAIRSFRTYAHTYTRPYPQNIEAMYRLTELYDTTGEPDKRRFWQEKIVETDRTASKSIKTDRTNRLTASALLDLAHHKAQQFRQRKLVLPLAENLRAKKRLLQESTELFGRASSYGFSDITTEATYSIGQLYQQFAKALINSERPEDLQGEELAQYNILIEDQAFPFEDKAIEFYEMNLARIKEGVSDQWVVESYEHLAPLFPARYNRQGKLSIYRDENS